jgi:LAO/AO transport system kinase
VLCSGLRNIGLDALWAEIERHRDIMTANGKFERRRQDQQVGWLQAMLQDRLLAGMLGNADAKAQLAAAESGVRSGAITAPQGVDAVLQAIGLGSEFGEA